jgi:hypothetical protein
MLPVIQFQSSAFVHFFIAVIPPSFRLFELEPDSKSIFGFAEKDYEKTKKFSNHAKYFIQMIDKALGMLGPESSCSRRFWSI